MKFIQLNCTSIRNKKHKLEQFLFTNNINICCLSETFLMRGEFFAIKNYNIIRSDRLTRSGGVAILIKNNIKFKDLNINSNHESIEICGCEITTTTGVLTVLSLYLPPNLNLSVSHLNSIINNLSFSSLLICGDFNAHHVCWGCADTNSRGRKVMNFIEDNELVLLNEGDHTYFGQSSSCLDLTITSSNLSLSSSWSTKRETLGSTHCIVETNLNITPSYKSLTSFIIPKDIKKDFLNKKLSEIFRNNDLLDPECSNRLELFGKEFQECFKIKTKNNMKPPNPWWNAECNRVSAVLRKAVSRFDSCPSRENFECLVSSRKTYKYITRKEKRNGWKNFCSTINSNMTVSELWKTVKCFKGNYNNSLIGFNECLLLFCDQLAGPSGPLLYKNPGPFLTEHLLLSKFTFSELDRAILGSKNSAPGIDGIRNQHLKNFSNTHKYQLLRMFNDVLCNGTIPYEWFQYKVMPLKKKDCASNLPTSYRSIALASTMRKLFERMLCSRLEWYLESNKKLNSVQSGFRRGKSTSDNVITLWSAAQLALASGEFLVAVFLDIKGAFDFVNINLLSEKLNALGVPNKFCELIYCLFQLKELYIQTDDGYIKRFSYTGVPQGCVLSPICFNIYINEVFNDFSPDIHLLAYADDIVIFSTNADPFIARYNVQQALSKISSSLKELQLSLSTTKTKAMMFTKKRFDPILAGQLVIDGEPIRYVETFNFLGFTFHKKLQLRPHVEKVAQNCFHYINVLRSLCGVSWGSDCLSLIRLYIGLVRPRLEYLAPLLLDCNKNEMLKLQRIQWKAIRTALGVMISSHTLAMEQIANILPLQERFELLSENYINKILSNYNHPAREFLFKLAVRSHNSIFVQKFAAKIQSFKIVQIKTHPMFSFPFSVLTIKTTVKFLPVNRNSDSSSVIKTQFENYIKKWEGYNRVYTDGSKTTLCVGCAIWFPSIDIEGYFPLHPGSSIFSAESYAIFEALKLINVQSDKKFVIISDSKSVLTALSGFTKSQSHPLIFKIKDLLYNLKLKGYIISFLWVPSHLGIEGNEYVDRVASTHIPTNQHHKIFPNDIKTFDKSTALNSWQLRWNNSEHGRHLHNIAPRINQTPWFYDLELPRSIISMINRLKINHTRCNDHIFKINIIDSNLCTCNEIQTVNHLLFCCINIDRGLRKDLIDVLVNYGISNFEISDILKLENVNIYKAIHKFFTLAKIDI